jgi:hypothetical protein
MNRGQGRSVLVGGLTGDRKLRPPQGWDYPLARSMFTSTFPASATSGDTVPQDVRLTCTSSSPQVGIPDRRCDNERSLLAPYPSAILDSVRGWFEDCVKAEALAWLKDVKRRAPATSDFEVWWWSRKS